MANVLGIDIGGTKIAFARYDAATIKQIDAWTIDSPDGYENVEKVIIENIVAKKEGLSAVGIGVPGLVEKAAGKILTLPNIPGSEGKDLAAAIRKVTGLPVVIGNDADLFTLAEALEGAGKGRDVVVGITLGTGVGGGVVIDGKVYRGAHGYAAEIGHMLLMPGKPPYETEDKRGDIEQFLSGTALGKRCAGASDPTQYLQGETCSFLHPDIFREIAWMIVNISHLLDPSIIVFGGSAGKALRNHLPAIREELKHWMLPGAISPELAVSSLNDAGTRGAAIYCLSSISNT